MPHNKFKDVPKFSLLCSIIHDHLIFTFDSLPKQVHNGYIRRHCFDIYHVIKRGFPSLVNGFAH